MARHRRDDPPTRDEMRRVATAARLRVDGHSRAYQRLRLELRLGRPPTHEELAVDSARLDAMLIEADRLDPAGVNDTYKDARPPRLRLEPEPPAGRTPGLTVPVLGAPLVVLGERDARWMAELLDELDRRDWFAGMPWVEARAAVVAAECRQVATGGQPEADGLLTPAEAAIVLAVSLRTVRRWVSTGRLPAVHVGRGVRIRRADVERVAS